MAQRVMCGTPHEYCSGSNVKTSSWLGSSQRVHSDSPQAFRCYARFLLATGYEAVGAREFRKVGANEGILVLTKKSHFGAILRTGKRPQGGGKANVFEPRGSGRKNATRSGVVF